MDRTGNEKKRRGGEGNEERMSRGRKQHDTEEKKRVAEGNLSEIGEGT